MTLGDTEEQTGALAREELEMARNERKKKKGCRGPRSKTGQGQTGTIDKFTVLMKSLKEKERLKDATEMSGSGKRCRDDDDREAPENDDMTGLDDETHGLMDETTPNEVVTLEGENLGRIPKLRMIAGRGARSETWREPRRKKIKQIKGQGLINWISGWVPGENEKEDWVQGLYKPASEAKKSAKH